MQSRSGPGIKQGHLCGCFRRVNPQSSLVGVVGHRTWCIRGPPTSSRGASDSPNTDVGSGILTALALPVPAPPRPPPACCLPAFSCRGILGWAQIAGSVPRELEAHYTVQRYQDSRLDRFVERLPASVVGARGSSGEARGLSRSRGCVATSDEMSRVHVACALCRVQRAAGVAGCSQACREGPTSKQLDQPGYRPAAGLL